MIKRRNYTGNKARVIVKVKTTLALFFCSISFISGQERNEHKLFWENSIGTDIVSRLYINSSLQFKTKSNILLQTQSSFSFSPVSIARVVDISDNHLDSRITAYSQLLMIGYYFQGNKIDHAVSIFSGPKYISLNEQLSSPGTMPMIFNNQTWLFDYGLHYNFKWHLFEKCYLNSQLNIPLSLIPDNLMNINVAIGIGLALK